MSSRPSRKSKPKVINKSVDNLNQGDISQTIVRQDNQISGESQRKKSLDMDRLSTNEEIEKIFDKEDPSLNDILKILKHIFISQQFIGAKYDEYLAENQQLKETCDFLNKENTKLKEDIKELNERVENNEYALIEKNIEIQGIPYAKDEKVTSTVITIAKNLGMDLYENEVNYAYRVINKRIKNNSKPDPIIVSFSRRETKEKLMSSRKDRSIYAREIGFVNSHNQIYINEQLTKNKKQLFWKARQLKKDKKYKYVWYKYGNIYLKRNDNAETIKIYNESDLNKL